MALAGSGKSRIKMQLSQYYLLQVAVRDKFAILITEKLRVF